MSRPVVKKNSTARIQSDTVLKLPFWDDFSTTTSGSPDPNRWQFSNSVWINNGMGINEPTINVATLDGLDSTNLAYNPNQTLVNGFADKLVSQPIDLTAVLPEHRDSIFLSFFYQWQGNGEAPDKNDYLTLEFKDTSSVWITVMNIYTKENPDPTIFTDTIIKVEGANYLHDSFQFRFRNFGRESGPFDTWNIDYVYMNIKRSTHDLSYHDVATASGVSPFFGDYYAIPLSHFFPAKKIDSVNFDFQLLQDIGLGGGGYRSTITSKRYYSDPDTTLTYSSEFINPGLVGSGILGPYERTTVKIESLPDVNEKKFFDSLASSIQIQLKMTVFTNINDTTGQGVFRPYNLHVNDTVSGFYTLKDYYAYDDGVAEYSAGLTQSGNLLAYQFNMSTTEPDTLLGFDAYFPDFALASNQTVNFYVYGDNGSGIPGSTLTLLGGQSLALSGILNGFTSVRFSSALLVQDKFYIGWKEPQTGHIRVGLDTSHDTGDKMFVNTTNAWVPNDVVHGSFMIRPVFGKGSIVTGLPPAEKYLINVYPNPNDGTFFVDGQYDHLQVITITGQQVRYLAEDLGENKKITLQAAPGLYIVHVQKGKNSEARKIVVR